MKFKVYLICLSLLLACDSTPEKKPLKKQSVEIDGEGQSDSKMEPLGKNDFKDTDLEVEQISEGTYVHRSFLEFGENRRVSCNGLIIHNQNEVVVVDTPVDSISSVKLIQWIHQNLKAKIKAVLPTHFHVDCTGGINAFQLKRVDVLINNETYSSAKGITPLSQVSVFRGSTDYKVGNKPLFIDFLGEGHTKDNIVVYYPYDKVMFGGCLIKAGGAGEGNLEDANVAEWPETVKRIKRKYVEVDLLVPGHGKVGGAELFDYTIHLFENRAAADSAKF